MITWTEKEAIEFTIASAREAIDQAADFESLDYAIEAYSFNLQDTLKEYRVSNLFGAAILIFRTEIERIIGHATTAKI